MIVSEKDLEELYELVSELFSCTDEAISEGYYWELQERFEATKGKIEAES